MSNKNIKVGDIGNLRVTVANIDDDGWFKFRTNEKYISFILSPDEVAQAFTPLPKYDPHRKFREKDKVRVKREVNGRPVYIGEDAWEPLDPSEIWEVVEEKETGWVHLKNGCVSADVWHAMLELVTTGEELGPYSIVQPENYKCVRVMEGKRIHSSIPFDEDECVCLTLEQALAAAEAERDRLNARWRKEQE